MALTSLIYNASKNNDREQWRRTLAEAGLTLVDGSFEEGATVNSKTDAVWHISGGQCYAWDGELPKDIPARSNPAGDANWKPQTDHNLRDDLADAFNVTLGDAMVAVKQPFAGGYARTQHDRNTDAINVRDFGAIGDGVGHPLSERYATLAQAQAVYPFVTSLTQTIDYAAIQAALNAVFSRGGGDVFIPPATSDLGYITSDTIVVPDKVNVYGAGYMSAISAASSSLAAGSNVVSLDTGPYSTGRFLQYIRIIGNAKCNGLGTTIEQTDTTLRYVYGFDIRGVSVQNVDEAFLFQGLWHSTIDNCTSAACRIGMHFWGQCVSIHVSGCHMRRTVTEQIPNSFGFLINPRTYAYDPGNPKRSEAIIIDGESMAIGFDTGLRLTDGLDMHFSNLDLDYCQTYGVAIANVNATFTLTDSWIAADAAATGQFIGVLSTAPTNTVQKRIISGCNFHAANSNALNNNIAIDLKSGNDFWSIENCTFNNGRYSIFANTCRQVSISNCLMGAEVYMTACQDFKFYNCRLAGLTEVNKPTGTFHRYTNMSGTPATHGIVLVPIAAEETSGTLDIPSGTRSLTYIVNKWDRNSAGSNDTVSVSGVTITVNRSVAVGLAMGTFVEYVAI